MTITIKTAPANKFQPAFNPIVWVVDSNNKAQTGFKYVFDLYLEGSGSPDLRIERFPRPDGYGLIDFSRIIQDFIQYNLQQSVTTFTTEANRFQSFTVKFGERYGGTLYADLTTSSEVIAFNAFFDFKDFLNYSEGTYLVNTSGSILMTNNKNQRFTLTDNGTLSLLVNVTDKAKTLEIKTYSGASLIQTATITNPLSTISSNARRFQSFPAFPVNLNAATLATGSQSLITDSITSYTLQLLDSGAGASSELITFNLYTVCKDYTRIYFMNQYGVFDAFNFTKARNITTDFERSTFEKKKGSMSGAGVWSYASTQRGKDVFNIESLERWRLVSDWLTDQESTWLKELIGSPQIFAEFGGVVIPVAINQAQYQTRQAATDRIFNLDLEIEFDKERRNAS